MVSVRGTSVAVLGVLLIVAGEVAGAPAKSKGSPAPLTAKSLAVGGLSNEATLAALFRGEFETIDLKREEVVFVAMLNQYLEVYAEKCHTHLPANKVEMTRSRCKTEEITRNGFGVEISRSCVNWVEEGTGLYAKPDLYRAKKEIDRVNASESLRNAWRVLLMAQKNSGAGVFQMAGTVQAAANDIEDLFQLNGCTSPGLKRFEENLRRFALNQESLRLEGAVKPAVAVPALSDQEYTKLIEGLVADQAQAWAMNRYVHGSVTDVTVSARDAAGRPLRIAASYGYEGINGRSQGSLTVHFTEGSPDCLYFFDAPATCRTPNRKIAAAFTAGAGQKPSTSKASASPRPAPVAPAAKTAGIAPAEPESPTAPPPAAPKRKLRAINYIQGIKDACLETLGGDGGDLPEPEESYCFCLSAAAGSIPISDADAQWLFENFSETALETTEQKYPGLARRFGSCRAQLEANR